MTFQKNETNYSTMLFALVSGAAAGIAIGLMMAPKSGDKLRADIGVAVDEYLDAARKKAEELKTSATNMAQRGLREVQKTKDAASDKMDKMKDAVSGSIDAGAQEAHGAISNTAKKSHQAVDYAADAARTGTAG